MAKALKSASIRNMLRLLFASLLAVFPISAHAAACRLALVLALDVSGSVNDAEYQQQLNGLAHALGDTEVRRAILEGGTDATVQIAVFEWSSRNHQFLVLPWTILDNHAAIDAATVRIRAFRKQRAGLKTALSTALLFAGEMLRDKQHCWQSTIDVSGDGKNNVGPSVQSIYGQALFDDVTVNALVVGTAEPSRRGDDDFERKKLELKQYFETQVIRGPASFAIIAHGYEDYARAMQLKLLREIAVPVFGQVQE